MDLVIAGASFPCGVKELGEVALSNGFRPVFIEHKQNSALIESRVSPLSFESQVPPHIALRNGLFLPLLESWVSVGKKLPNWSGLQFDRRAAAISRSKLALSTTLAKAKVKHVPRYQVESLEKATQLAQYCGFPVVLRTDSGYSGRGVWVADNPNDIRKFWLRLQVDRDRENFIEMRSVLDVNDNQLIMEPVIPGIEWSIDCVVSHGKTLLIRVCEKVTTISDGKPVTLGYRLTDSVELWSEIRQVVDQWTRALFIREITSFACFDIRRNPDGDLVPLDFGVRLGGDCIPILVRLAGNGKNPYAAALNAALSGDPTRMQTLSAGPAIVHAFARKAGVFVDITVHRQSEVVHTKPSGFIIHPNYDFEILRRVGSVLTYFNSYDEFIRACLTSTDWIEVAIN